MNAKLETIELHLISVKYCSSILWKLIEILHVLGIFYTMQHLIT